MYPYRVPRELQQEENHHLEGLCHQWLRKSQPIPKIVRIFAAQIATETDSTTKRLL
jgi:hypothetical protein